MDGLDVYGFLVLICASFVVKMRVFVGFYFSSFREGLNEVEGC